ncbi:MAG: SAM-dependent DNA methyltransferase, partial [Actinobacteria bacterium]|nr:SAM-dependent DNA methyltransferase [Actinomycetota bacterium]
VLVIALVSKTVMPVRVPTGQVFSHRLGVFATNSFGDQAVLSSTPHWLWAVTYSSTLETRVNYSPSDAFVTFPRPIQTGRLDDAGQRLESMRRETMMRRGLGLTKLYNLINDSVIHGDKDVDQLREIHVEIDEATIAAYGWNDISLNHGFHAYRQVERWSVCSAARAALLDRLLEENHHRSLAQHELRVSGQAEKITSDDETLYS